MDDSEVNILEQVDGGGWLYRPTSSSSEASYEIAAIETDKLAAGLGVEAGEIQKAWRELFETSGRQVALTWLRKNDIPTKTRYSWVKHDWDK